MDKVIIIETRFLILVFALMLDLLLGEKPFIRYHLYHPIVWIGWVINKVDKYAKSYAKYPYILFLMGVFLICVGGFFSFIVSYGVEYILASSVYGAYIFVSAIIVWILIAIKSLYEHVVQIEHDLQSNDLDKARQSLSKIVGRDTDNMSSSDVVRASLESLAESVNDAIIAPIFYYMLLGLGGIIFYKIVNTADSMIGKKTGYYRYFGKCAARVDDILNFVPSRLCFIVLYVIYAWRQRRISLAHMYCSWQDANKHESINAGYSEIGFAIILCVQLGGMRRYNNIPIDAVILNPSGRYELTYKDINRGLKLYQKFLILCFTLMLILIGFFMY